MISLAIAILISLSENSVSCGWLCAPGRRG